MKQHRRGQAISSGRTDLTKQPISSFLDNSITLFRRPLNILIGTHNRIFFFLKNRTFHCVYIFWDLVICFEVGRAPLCLLGEQPRAGKNPISWFNPLGKDLSIKRV